MEVKICIGTSCHRQGAEKVLKHFQTMIEEKDLKEKIQLKGSFCLGKCTKGKVTLLIDGKDYLASTPDDAGDFFEREILSRLG